MFYKTPINVNAYFPNRETPITEIQEKTENEKHEGGINKNINHEGGINKKPKKYKKPKKTDLKKLKIKLNVKNNEYRVFENPDKKLHQYHGDPDHPKDLKNSKINLYNLICPFRLCMNGGPNTGKTTSILNILCHLKPQPRLVMILHQEFFNPQLKINIKEQYPVSEFEVKDGVINEYKDINDAIILRTIPNEQYFIDKGCKEFHTVLILDDIALREWVGYSRDNATLINKTLSYYSTHYNISVLMGFQNIYSQALPCCYRFANYHVLFRVRDLKMVGILAPNVGMKTPDLKKLLALCKSSHDCVVLDLSNDSPAPYRINFTNVVEFK